MAKIRVLIADDQVLLRTALESSLSQERDIQVVGSAADGGEAVAVALRLKPDIALLDIKMPKLDGIAATKEIKERLPKCRVVIMTVLEEHEYLERAILAGADGYLLKDATRQDLVAGLRRVCKGECLIDPALMRVVIEGYRQAAAQRKRTRRASYPAGLTQREVETLHLVAEGCSNEEIALRANLAVGTVKMHLHRAFRKIGARDRTQAALYAIKKGL